jgi:hypothetical protein
MHPWQGNALAGVLVGSGVAEAWRPHSEHNSSSMVVVKQVLVRVPGFAVSWR